MRRFHEVGVLAAAVAGGAVLAACATPGTGSPPPLTSPPPIVRTSTSTSPAGGTVVLPGAAARTSVAVVPIARSDAPRLPVVASATSIGTPHTSGIGAGKVVSQVNPDGCDRAYGSDSQCVPLRAPGGKPVDCAYLTAEGFFRTPLVVHSDPLHLMDKPHMRMGVLAGGTTMTVLSCSDS